MREHDGEYASGLVGIGRVFGAEGQVPAVVPADLMRMWPISTRVNKPENDDPSILEPVELATDAA
jgi:hypothetical protein